MNKRSVKWKIFSYLLGFVAILLILLWLFQTVFLDSFYRNIKTRTIKSCAEEISKYINSDDLEVMLEKIGKENEMTIRIIDENGDNLYTSMVMPDSVIHKLSKIEVFEFYSNALKNNGSSFQMLSRNDLKSKTFNHPIGINPPPSKGIQSMIYVKILNKSDGTHPMLMLNSVITPVNATVETLRVQLMYISIILIILSLILAFFISRKISKPIIKINDSAKDLALGNYNTIFEGKGYREIEELNDTLNYAAKELSKVESLRRELISNISHDLRTPLTMITGYGEVIRDIPGENTPENIQIIIDESKHLSILVNDILDISKIQSGTENLSISRFNITESIRKIIKRYSKLVENNGYTIEFDYSEDIFVSADEVKISQVIYNLVSNGINYTGENKKIKVIQTLIETEVKIEVIDTGEGIDEEMLPYIFDRYYKTNKTHKRSEIGTGLGLSIVKGVLDLHSAKYGVISEKGKGSNFWFSLNIEMPLKV